MTGTNHPHAPELRATAAAPAGPATVTEFPVRPQLPPAVALPTLPAGPVTLVDLIERRGGFDWREAVAVIHQICLYPQGSRAARAHPARPSQHPDHGQGRSSAALGTNEQRSAGHSGGTPVAYDAHGQGGTARTSAPPCAGDVRTTDLRIDRRCRSRARPVEQRSTNQARPAWRCSARWPLPRHRPTTMTSATGHRRFALSCRRNVERFGGLAPGQLRS